MNEPSRRAGRAVRLGAGLLIAATLVVSAAPVRAGTGRHIPLGLRAIGMGGAAAAARDNVSALFWNPAGLAALDHQEIFGSRAELFGTDFRNDDVGVALPLARGRTLGFGWAHIGTQDVELTYAENRFDLGAGVQLHPRLAIGATLKYLTRSLDLDGVDGGRGQGVGCDVGVQGRLLRNLDVGVAIQDLTASRIAYEKMGSSVVYPRSLRAGADWQPSASAHVAIQIDDQWHAGGEFVPDEVLALRAGLRQSLDNPEAPIWSVGAGLRVGPLRFDYAREMHPFLDDTQHLGLSVAFQFNPSLLSVEAVDVDDIFLSLYPSYQDEPPVVARLRNKSTEPLEVFLKLECPGLTRQASERTVLLRPGVATEVRLPLLLDRSVLGASRDRRETARVTASYAGPRIVRHESRAASGFVFGPGAIDWDRGVEQVAAFVTPEDPALAGWARDVIRSVTPEDSLRLGSGRMAGAAALFVALHRMGLRYVPDPLNPYAAVSRATGAVDVVHYPRETLKLLSGDCDDTSVLLISLLHNIGTETRLVDLPGHLMILVDTGIHPVHRLAFEADPDRTVVIDGRLWVPLETTALAAGFEGAWREGARVYGEESARGRVRRIDIVAAQRRYPPPPFTSDLRFELADSVRAALRRDLERDGRLIDAGRQARLAPRPGSVAPAASDPVIANGLAGLDWRAGRYADARRRLLGLVPGDPSLRCRLAFNRALVEIEDGNESAARAAALEARQCNPDDPALVELERFIARDRGRDGGITRPGLTWKE